MTKLTEWLTVLGALFFLWLALITNKIENNFTRQHPDLLLWSPIIFVIVFGVSHSRIFCFLAVVLKINNCSCTQLALYYTEP